MLTHSEVKWKSLSHAGLFVSPWTCIVRGILQSRILEWVAFPFSGASSQPKDRTQVSCSWILYQLSHKGNPRILEWVAYPFSSGSSQPRNLTGVSCLAGGFFTSWATRKFTRSNLQIQCNSYQITNGIFHRTRMKNFTICMETHKILNSQSNLEKEKWSWRNQPSWLQTILQIYSHQDSMVLAQKEKYRPTEQERKPRNKPMHLWVPYFWQRK